MEISGTHKTRYEYSAPVFLEPHTVRLQPRSDPHQLIRSFSIDIDPAPDGLTEGLDLHGNDVLWTWFSGEHRSLEIRTRFVVETRRGNPFNFLVPSEEAGRLPPAYPEVDRAALEPYLAAGSGPGVKELAEEAAEAAGRRLVPFLSGLCADIHERCETIVRPEGDPLSADVTLSDGRGSCRDLSVLFAEACRHVGVAARFVSGYVEVDPSEELRELHAWGAAYVPGAGWRGYDPTEGLAVSERHITLAAAAAPAGAAPVEGRFRGSGVRSRLASTIELHAVRGSAPRTAG